MKTSPWKTVMVFDPHYVESIPQEVHDELREVWIDNELGNDTSYYSWDRDLGKEWEEEGMYPHLNKYLMDSEYTDVLIHWWW